jgi:GntP family gluconate:H+ symporter
MTIVLLAVSVVLIVLLTTRFKVHPFIALFLVSLGYGLMSGMPLAVLVTSMNEGFAGTLGKIGLIIVFGIIIGAFLEKSGAAYTLADRVLKLIGRKRVLPAMGVIGYLISIPVFADSGFLLVSPLNKTVTKKAGLSLAGTAVALGLGLSATHTMVPPTPGPVAAAGILQADLGLVMMLGLPISAAALVIGLLYARWYASRTWLEPNPGVAESEIDTLMRSAPPAARSSLPIVVPILLIVLKSVGANTRIVVNPLVASTLSFLGEPVIALFIGAVLCLTLPRKVLPEMLSTEGWVGSSVRDAASILLITGAGGIFGRVLQDSGIAGSLGGTLMSLRAGFWLPFLLAAAIKTAQGSSTVAMITAASILSPIMGSLGFDSEIQKSLVVIALGAGSLVVCHANDSFFWVLTQMTGMKVNTGYRIYTSGTFVLGISAALVVYLTSLMLS